jgi:drug/metabolite transporter (DMT)-like permease
VTKAGRRYWRTIILGILALGGLVWVAVDQFDVPREELQELMLGTVIAVILVIGAAAVFALAWVVVRRLIRRD